MSRFLFFLILFASLLICSPVPAADQKPSKVDSLISSVEQNKSIDLSVISPDVSVFRTQQEKNKMYMLVSILVVSPLFLFLILFSIKKTADHAADHIVNASALVLVIQATTFIVIAAPTSEQLTAAIGVLGAIAGYIFGSSARRGVPDENASKTPEEPRKGLHLPTPE